MSQEDLAKKFGYKSFTTVQKWEDGTAFPKIENLNKIAQIFNVELDHLLNVDLRTNKVKVPVLGEVKAGYDMYINEEILGYEYLNNNEYTPGEYFYLKVKGDSMINDRICEGDIVYVRKQDYLENNDLGVFVIDNDEVTIKRIEYMTVAAAAPPTPQCRRRMKNRSRNTLRKLEITRKKSGVLESPTPRNMDAMQLYMDTATTPAHITRI